MKLNIGCTSLRPGSQYAGPEWVNLDLHAHARKVVRGDVRKLPFKYGAFEEVHLIHTLEHLGRWDTRKALVETYRVLAKQGNLYVEVPDWVQGCKLAYEAYERGDLGRVHDWNTGMYGKQRFVGDSHQSGFWPEKLAKLLHDAGYTQLLMYEDAEDMISRHYKVEPVILMRGTK